MLPAGIATGETFDRVLIRDRAVLMAEEFRANGVPITLRAAFGKATVRTFTSAVGSRETIASFSSVGVHNHHQTLDLQ
ncbi:hypothetical protein BDQ94DRAFT_176242 [Aspergillus welwitschiae]|uniref:Uncharacterized protein n=1 Tax=Aspergillus welwitschiae TaxID=1341132 RepID=A0A3F3PIF5_9EURO|nr:hypothetical protein BDQ94DRAFT_176242 [Aspergillus welwitschiae]RDH26647.1 hypothetical protein BDQ94DRAFT_176242 [Aspergillus welwitschiae]